MKACLAIRLKDPEMLSLAAQSLIKIVQYVATGRPFQRELLCNCLRIYYQLPVAGELHPNRETVVLKCDQDFSSGLVRSFLFQSCMPPSLFNIVVNNNVTANGIG